MKVQAEAEKFARAQEAEGIRAKGLAEAEAIRAKAVAEAEGIEKKAEAMTKMGKAAVLEMYFNALPDVVKNAAEPLTKVDKITMYGDGNSAKLTRDIMQTVTQVTDGLKESTGVDLQSVLSGFLGGKLADAAQPAPPHRPSIPAPRSRTPAHRPNNALRSFPAPIRRGDFCFSAPLVPFRPNTRIKTSKNRQKCTL